MFLSGCTAGPPPISTAIIASGAERGAGVDQLTNGRSLFVSRCLQCHALPQIGGRSPAGWRKIVSQMAGRSHLSSSDEEAVVAYLIAAISAPTAHVSPSP
jgi:mono/diheme cytochrome c family protein